MKKIGLILLVLTITLVSCQKEVLPLIIKEDIYGYWCTEKGNEWYFERDVIYTNNDVIDYTVENDILYLSNGKSVKIIMVTPNRLVLRNIETKKYWYFVKPNDDCNCD